MCLCGRGNRSSLRILQHGLGVTEMAVSDMPGNPSAVWTVRKSARCKKFVDVPHPGRITKSTAEGDDYIVVSFVGATLVLSIGERVEEVTDSGLLLTSTTLCVSRLGEDALLQVGTYSFLLLSAMNGSYKRGNP